MKKKEIFFLISGILIGIILLQNTQVVSFRFLFWELSMSRIILFPLVLILGFFLGYLVEKRPKKPRN